MYNLYGDGIHDDTSAIQEMIDSGVCEVALPAPKAHYVISKSLELPSNFRLCVPRFAEIRLAKGSNCVMLKNKTVTRRNQKKTVDHLFDYINEYADDAPCCNIEVVGGIWNCNNLEQNPNPIQTRVFEPAGYNGFGFLFYNVKNLRISSLTIKDPVNFAVTLDTVSYFTVDNIIFDFNYGNPLATNMDGIHCNGNCSFGRITDLKGACYDDLVALNAEEGSGGPITDIKVSGIYTQDCHSAVRMLSAKSPIKNIHISDVYGTFYQYCVGVTKYYHEEGVRGYCDGITLDHIHASKAVRLPVYNKAPNEYVPPLICIEAGIEIHSLKISDLHRREYVTPVETIHIYKNADIETLILENISTENHTGTDSMPVLVNRGNIRNFVATNIRENGVPVTLG